MDSIRQSIVDSVIEEIYGPIGKDDEEALEESPLKRYFTGVLYPQKSKESDFDESDETVFNVNDTNIEKQEQNQIESKHKDTFLDLSEDEEGYLSLSNAFHQSALSITVFLKYMDEIKIKVSGAIYYSEKGEKEWFYTDKNGETINKSALIDFYKRKPISLSKWIKVTDLDSFDNLKICDNPKIVLSIYPRWQNSEGKAYTFSLINESIQGVLIDYKQCFFQSQLCLKSTLGFNSINNRRNDKRVRIDEDGSNNTLLYRNEKRYAIGHGCSPVWKCQEGNVFEIETSFVPVYELSAIVPRNSLTSEKHRLSMENFFRQEKKETIEDLKELSKEYENWILSLETDIQKKLEQEYFEQANKNLSECKECLNRINDGIQCISENENAFLAFKLMNKAMLLQQLHSRRELRKFKHGKEIEPKMEIDLDDKKTWPGIPDFYGKWRIFQLAFILINIHSIIDRNFEDRKKVDLIWFPTGGGKTEAYLGLTAFVIFYKRLTKQDDSTCCQVIMRYTLRLLTSQQYERASSLICACEFLRRKNPSLLGDKRITIGLWVGSKTTPNTRSEALKAKNNHNYVFSIRKCPWCGAEIGACEGEHEFSGIAFDKLGGSDRHLVFNCANPKCEFHDSRPNKTNYLPLKVIDQDIYEEPPTLLIGTVDKFAMVPLANIAVRNLFGLKNGAIANRSHPELIIQDELHLISGPLGSTVSAYETMIDFLCSIEIDNKQVNYFRPKIIASTATIARAKDQCHNLYNLKKEDVKIFPPSGLNNGDTYFSNIDKDKPGRAYVGLFMPGATAATGLIHFLGSQYIKKTQLSYENNGDAKNAYWTNVCYFNSIRELARAATWVHSDIFEYAKIVYRRQGDYTFGKNRDLPVYIELNSRNTGADLNEYFNQLTINFDPSGGKKAVDFCLATNMISVGLDVNRLGLMVIMGQPKTTAEYIQASSRVGRGKIPGLVFTTYGTSKPRDKSIFEDFQNYHSKFYSFVEPTSVSPFCSELREKVLPAIITGMTRGIQIDSKQPFRVPLKLNERVIKNYILDRVKFIDDNEYNDTSKQLDSIYRAWDSLSLNVAVYSMNKDDYRKCDEGATAIYPKDFEKDLGDDYKKSFSAPTSMRDVDTTSQLEITDDYIIN